MKKVVGTLALLVAALSLVPAVLPLHAQQPPVGAAPSADLQGIQAITTASGDVSLSFSKPGRITEVFVKRGDRVKAGDRLAQQDDREEQAQLTIDEAKAKDMNLIELEDKTVEQKKVDLKRLESLPPRATSPFEVEHARLDVEIEIARLKNAKLEHEQDLRKVTLTKAIIEKLQMRSPIDGLVETIWVKAGESTDQQNKLMVMRVVNVDPLWIEVPVPMTTARTLKKSQPARVVFPDQAEMTGRIETVSQVADAASETLNVRVEVANPAGPHQRPAGERVTIDFAPVKTASNQ